MLEENRPVLCAVTPREPGDSGEIVLADPVWRSWRLPIVSSDVAKPIGVIQLDTEDAGRRSRSIRTSNCCRASARWLAQLIEHARLIEKSRAEEMLAREHAAERNALPREVLELLPVGVFLERRQR